MLGTFFGIAGYVYFQIQQEPVKPKARDLSAMVEVSAGLFTDFIGEVKENEAFWIDAHEVTIAEYAKFLDALAILGPQEISIYQHPSQPLTKHHHRPDDWQNMLTAATNGTEWNGKAISPNHPVVNVDWWDAYAFAKFHRRMLPNADQWCAALHFQSNDKASPLVSQWGAVDHSAADTTKAGIHGLAGNVAEWCAELSKDPTAPAAPKLPVALGGSYAQPQSSAISRQWIHADRRNTRRPDLGFRTVSTVAPRD